MTKARDIASASPAPSTVSATEIGYLDGVTSAIQTQIDSKIGSASAISPTLIDAKGDLIVGSAADTAARLAVGTNDYVLTADSAATNGVKWAAPAGGGSGLTLIQRTSFSNVANTGTTFDNVFTSTYKFYQVVIEKLNGGTNDHDSIFELLYSGTVQSATYYGSSGGGRYDTGNFSGIANSNTAQFTFDTHVSGSSNPSSAILWFTKVGNTSENPNWHGLATSPDDPVARAIGGNNQTAQTYTGIRFRSSSSNITGTVAIYGLATA